MARDPRAPSSLGKDPSAPSSLGKDPSAPSSLGLSRRALLRGAAGVAVALPWLPSLARGSAATSSARRFVLLGAPISTSRELRDAPVAWEFGAQSGPLAAVRGAEPLAGVLQHTVAIGNTRIPTQTASGTLPPAGRYLHPDSFHHHFNPLLAGIHQIGGIQGEVVTGPTTDQIAAHALDDGAPFPSLSLSAQQRAYVSDPPIQSRVMSYRDVGGEIRGVLPFDRPVDVYVRLTSQLSSDDPAVHAERVARLAQRRSVLDVLDLRARALRDRLSSADAPVLEQHLDLLRDLELRLSADLLPAAPEAERRLSGFEADGPTHADRLAQMRDLTVFALNANLTRVVALALAWWKSYVPLDELGGPSPLGLHQALHDGTDDEFFFAARWATQAFADLVSALDAVATPDGTLLSSTLVAMLPEGGCGNGRTFASDLSVVETGPTSHTTDAMTVLAAGAGLQGGRYIHATGADDHLMCAFNALLRRFDPDHTGIGEVTGAVPL